MRRRRGRGSLRWRATELKLTHYAYVGSVFSLEVDPRAWSRTCSRVWWCGTILFIYFFSSKTVFASFVFKPIPTKKMYMELKAYMELKVNGKNNLLRRYLVVGKARQGGRMLYCRGACASMLFRGS